MNPVTLLDAAMASCDRLETLAGLLEAAGQGDVVEGRVVRGTGTMIAEEVGRVRELVKALQAAKQGQ